MSVRFRTNISSLTDWARGGTSDEHVTQSRFSKVNISGKSDASVDGIWSVHEPMPARGIVDIY